MKGRLGAAARRLAQIYNLVYSNDSRLTDARTPTAHAASHNAGGSDVLAIDAAAGTGSLRTLGTAATAACGGADVRLALGAETGIGLLKSPLSSAVASFTFASGTACFLYVGYLHAGLTIKYVQSVLTANGTTSQTGEVGIFSTPLAGYAGGQTLTCLAADGTIDTLLAGAVKVFKNTNGFNSGAGYVASSGFHAWLGMRTAFGGSQPSTAGLIRDMGHGWVLKTAAAAVFAVNNTYTGALLTGVDATGSTPIAPDLRATTA